MAKQILEIGDTGSELVSKFNNNSDDSYNSISTINNRVIGEYYTITDYGCTGDANTDNTVAFNAILTTISTSEATIKIPNGRFIIGTCTIPANVELIFSNGGRIIWKSGSTIVIHGHINASHKWIFENQSEVADDLATVSIHRQECISPIWWGGKMSGADSDKTINYNAFRSAWNCAGRVSQSADGCAIKFPSGTFITKAISTGTDGWEQIAKYSNLTGAGRTKTTIMLAASENKRLLNSWSNYDFQIRDIAFNGNASNNTEMTDLPLIQVNYYRVDFKDFAIINCSGDGLWITDGQNNSYHIHNPLIYGITGIGIKLSDVINATVDGMIDIESVGTGIQVTSTVDTCYDSRYHSRVVISGSWYGESVGCGLHLKGIADVKANFAAYMRAVTKVLWVEYDSDRDIPCMFNYLDIRATRDEKALNDTGIVISDKCCFNTIWVDPSMKVTDSDGRNSYNGLRWCERKLSGDKTVTQFLTNTNPANNTVSGAGSSIVSGNIFNDTVCYKATYGACRAYIASGGLAGKLIPVFEDINEKYFICVVKGKAGSNGYFYLNRQTITAQYDFPRKTWVTGDWAPYNNHHFILDLNGDWQTFVIPFIPSGTEYAHYTAIYGGHNDIEVVYVAVTDSADTSFIHVIEGDIVGYGDGAFMLSDNIPPADEVSIGTKVFATDLKMEVISDGIDWCKPDGTVLGSE